ncbi:hypothetical protein NVV99_24825 [Rhodococcus sp. PAE-6]|uniref:hypothetical protein n=1 Tax=Rhodococcus sp. PAE-6 TaxID=2972477 RepID=UPI0021B3F948|nr:hypothetical protein [Rhodococcus sp. PAE-6]MCT7294122.1 hypothetical protein [Rhodococcus sp. PAE-6]
MNRDELGRAIKAACANLDEPRVIVLGSQSILGSFDITALPPAAFLSREVDILPLRGSRSIRRKSGGFGVSDWWARGFEFGMHCRLVGA